jgi:hypothetical protein
MTDISLQKTAKTAEGPRATVREGPVRQFCRPAASLTSWAARAAKPLLAIETSDFGQRLQFVEASDARAAAAMYGAGPGGYLNSEARFCCRFAADAARRNRRCNS